MTADTTHTERGSLLRVALVSPFGTQGDGGISRFCAYLTRRCSALPDVSVTVVRTIRTRRPVLRSLAELGILARFAVRCRRGAFDVVHVNVAPGNSTWRKARFTRVARWAGCATIAHLHGNAYDEWYDGLSSRGARRVRRFFGSVDGVIVCGVHWRDVVVGRLGCDPSRTTIIANGAPDTGEIAEPTHHPVRLVCLGQLGERKGTDVLLRALALLPDDDEWHIHVAGPGASAPHVALRDSLGLTERVTFPGWWPEATARSMLAASDVFVLASRRENQPVAIIEAMAAGLPIVSTRIAAIPETVDHEVTGIVVPADDVEALASALDRLIRSPRLRAEMGRQARLRYEEKYTIERCADEICAVYRALVPSARPTP